MEKSILKSLYLLFLAIAEQISLAGSIRGALPKFAEFFADESAWAMLHGHFNVIETFARAQYRQLRRHHPNFTNKYLIRYLARSFTKHERRHALLYNYEVISEKLSENFLPTILSGAIEVWSTEENGGSHIQITFNHHSHNEGDILFQFRRGGISLYEIGASITPGKLTASDHAQVLFVGCVQGARSELVAIREAARENCDISPSYLLMAAVAGFSECLRIPVIAGVSKVGQLSNSRTDSVYFDYDRFWRTFSAHRTQRGFYEIDVPLVEGDLSTKVISHRRRIKKKRRFRKRVSETVCRRLTLWLKRPVEAPNAVSGQAATFKEIILRP